MIIKETTGNVGIGTTAPTHKLTVIGMTNTTGGLIANDTLFVNGSRVGIGTDSPASVVTLRLSLYNMFV